MGLLRRSLYRFVYPLPAKEEDPLRYKETFIDDYTQISQIKRMFRIYVLAQLISSEENRKNYVKKAKDAEQKSRLEAHKFYIHFFRSRG